MDRGIRSLNVTLLTLLVTATISGVVAFGVGFPGPARWVLDPQWPQQRLTDKNRTAAGMARSVSARQQ